VLPVGLAGTASIAALATIVENRQIARFPERDFARVRLQLP